MKRKYMSEFGLHTYSSYLSICYPNDLNTLQVSDQRYHIYMITLVPKLTFNKDSLQIFEDHISLEVNVKTEEKEETETLEFCVDPSLNHTELNFEIDKPRKSLKITNDDGTGVIARVLPVYTKFSRRNLETEIIYIGQSFGKDGERTAPERLKSHSTLQKIQSELLFEAPEQDLALVLLEFTPQLLSSMDGITKNYETSDEEDRAHLKRIMSNPPTDRMNQIINITEAALINYFKPEYNEKFKDNFPDVEHKGYKQYYDLDYNAIAVELDPDAIGLKFFSKEKDYPLFESIKYTLHPENIRRSMFDIFPTEDEETQTINE
ncbi:hypothetical protein [Priestia megaterium]